MRRREFITLVGGAAAWPLAARAQQPRRVGVLIPFYSQTDRQGQASIAAFLDTFQRLGWADGRNVRIESRWGAGDAERTKGAAAELVRSAPDAIVVAGSSALAELQRLTSTTPSCSSRSAIQSPPDLCPVLRGRVAMSLASKASSLRWAASGWECSRRLCPT